MNLYNEEQKNAFVETIGETSRKKFALSFFKKASEVEYHKDRDINTFTTDEVIEFCMEQSFISSKEIWLIKRILDDYATFCGCKPIEMLSELEYKKRYIDRGVMDYVLTLQELLSEMMIATRKYCVYEKYYDDSEWFMPKAYIALLFLGISDDIVRELSIFKLQPDYILPNGKSIGNDKDLVKLLLSCAKNDEYTNIYNNGQHRIRHYKPDFEGQIIKMSPITLQRAWQKMVYEQTPLNSKLIIRNVINAGRFSDIYNEDLKAERLEVTLTRGEIVATMNNNLTPNGLSLRDEELYQIYKAIRLKRFASLLSQ